MVTLNIPNGTELLPENDLQELWMMYGRAEALRAMVKRRRKRMFDNMDLVEIEDIMGWPDESRHCGHPASED